MSYDLMVFEPDAAPHDRAAFVEWFGKQMESEESSDDPAITSEKLRRWFDEIRTSFSPLNGPFAAEELPEDDVTLTDYSITKYSIYVCFPWSMAAEAYDAAFYLAKECELGFYNVSSDQGEIWLPEQGRLVLLDQEAEPSFLRRLKGMFSKQ